MDKFGLIGFPLGHSFSKNYFNEKFENEGIDARYINFEIPAIENLTEILDSNPTLKGLNVTIPYKQKVMSYLDAISPEARAIGAVNVIKVTHKGKKVELKGFNSDVIGFTKSRYWSDAIRRHLSWEREEPPRPSTTDSKAWGWRPCL